MQTSYFIIMLAHKFAKPLTSSLHGVERFLSISYIQTGLLIEDFENNIYRMLYIELFLINSFDNAQPNHQSVPR